MNVGIHRFEMVVLNLVLVHLRHVIMWRAERISKEENGYFQKPFNNV